MSCFLSFHRMAKKIAWHFCILFMYDLVSSSCICNTVLFDCFAVHEIRSIIRRKDISVASSFFVAVLKLSRLRIHILEWIQYSTSRLFFMCSLKCIYLLALISFSRNSFLLALFRTIPDAISDLSFIGLSVTE